MVFKELQDAGLSDKESKVYLAALELGEGTIAQITRKSGVKRPTVYLEIENLKEKGLMSAIKRKNRTVYFAEDPRKLEERIDEKKHALLRAMPELLAIANAIDRKPKIRYFEGEDGIKTVYKDTLKYPDQEMCSWFSETFKSFDEQFFLDYYISKRKEKKIWARVLLPDNPAMREFAAHDVEHLRQSKLIASQKFNVPVEINLYGKNKVGLMSYEEELGIIIESQKIYASLKSLFEVMWESN